jgi:ABC-2 type transport system permease protein
VSWRPANWQHLKAFVWLRWRLLANGWRRGGQVNYVITMVFAVCALVAALPLFVGGCLAGLFLLGKLSPVHLLYVWDGLCVAFVFLSCVGLLTELQRTESLSLSKFLHLPVSLEGAFFINYLSSLFSLTTVLFVPILFGLALGLAFSKGMLLLITLPLSAAFLLTVTALSYQFQGWLASLMSNPRRRRTVIVAATAVFILCAQLPNLLNLFAPWQQQADRSSALVRELEGLNRDFQAKKFDAQEHLRRQQQIMEKHEQENKAALAATAQKWQRAIKLLNWVLPIGWFPLGVMEAAEGNVLVPSLALVLLTTIGAGSLWRSYRTTLQLYRGQFTARKSRAAKAPDAKTSSFAPATGTQFLERRLPGLSEPVSAIALAGLRSLLRSPEAKMMLMTPLIMSLVAGGAILRHPNAVPLDLRPLTAFGAMIMVLFGMMQIMGNQFGCDRDGFRVFVLCAAPRRDILLGKNLAFFPLAAAMAGMLLALLEVLCPLRVDHLLAMPPQFVSMFLLFCLLVNLTSIYAPFYIAAGALKPGSPKMLIVLLQMAMFMVFFPLSQLPTLLPLGIEALAEQFGWTRGVPIFLLLALVECVAVAFLYRWALAWQGGLLERREQQILQAVTKLAS